MEQYVTAEYYLNEYKGTELSKEDNIDAYLELASEKVNTLTFNRIVKIGFDNLTELQKSYIQKAVCYQADYIAQNGVQTLNITSFSVLDINVTMDDKKSVETLLSVSEIAYDYIRKTGLACRSMRWQ